MKIKIKVPFVFGGLQRSVEIGEVIEVSGDLGRDLISGGLADTVRETATKGARRTACLTQSRIESPTQLRQQ